RGGLEAASNDKLGGFCQSADGVQAMQIGPPRTAKSFPRRADRRRAIVKRDISRAEFVALIAALMAVDALAIDIMLPALPDIGDALMVANANDRSLVMTAFLIGFGLPQLVFGPLTDRFGRRAPILIGMATYA